MKASHPESADRCVYGHKFRWTSEHISSEALHPLIYTYDTLATEALDRLDELAVGSSSPVTPITPTTSPEKFWDQKKVATGPFTSSEQAAPKDEKAQGRKHRDMYAQVLKYKDQDEVVSSLWSEVNIAPDWVDWDEIEKGQKVFWRYGGPAITGLIFLSLLGGMGSGRTVETLDRTGSFAAPVVRRRLFETCQHLFAVQRDLNSIKPGGDGWSACVRIRLLHAMVRRRILKLGRDDPKYYNVERLGVPINGLDCIGTINMYCTSLIWIGLPRQGIHLRPSEINSYLNLWRYVSYLMGVPHDWLSQASTAKAMLESCLVSEMRPTPSSANLANNLLTGLVGTPPMWASRGYLVAQARWMNGDQMADELDIGARSTKERTLIARVRGTLTRIWKGELWYKLLMAIQCAIFLLLAWASRMSRWWDETSIRLTRALLHEFLIHNKSRGALGYKTAFVMKWFPHPARLTTARGAPTAEQVAASGPWPMIGMEHILVWALLWVSVLLLGIGWGAWRSVV